jgi:hypothetical protein
MSRVKTRATKQRKSNRPLSGYRADNPEPQQIINFAQLALERYVCF